VTIFLIGGVRMAWRSGLRRWVSIAAAASLAVTAAAMILALVAADGASAANRELSQRLVPAAAAAGALLGQYTAQQTALRNYVTGPQPTTLAPYLLAASQIPGQQARVAALLRGYPRMPAQLAASEVADRAWLAKVARPQLAAAAHGDFARARALQADIPLVRHYVLAVRSQMATLQAQITSMQARVTARLAGAQRFLLAALVAVCVVVAVITAGGVVAVRRWLLSPFTALRQAADSVAAGNYGTRVPAVGPTELAELGRATELMRTRLVAALAEAGRAEERFRGLFESSPDATLTVAADGSIVMMNARAGRMFGYDAGELAGRPVEMLVPAATREFRREQHAGSFADPVSRPTGAARQLSAVGKDGLEFPVEISLSSLPAGSGTVTSVAIRDISDRLAAQAEQDRLRGEAERERYARRLQQSERLESLGQLVGGVAHDFNNLLNIISGYTDFIAEQVTDMAAADTRLETVLADVEQVRSATQRAVRLTRQLLIFARHDVVHPEVLDANSVVSGVEEMLGRTLGEHINLTITREAGLWPVMADAGQLEQVLVNLAINARDAMPGGGTLTIDTGNIDADKDYAGSRPGLAPGRYVRIRVSDTGTGMDREVLDRVFEPFFSTKPKGSGTGLGLAAVYGIITQAHGYVQIYSEPGLGTTVSALLPVTAEAAAPAQPADEAPAPGRGETVLLVEDQESLLLLTSRILTSNGYQVCAAAPADAIRRAGDPQQPVNLLLTDVVMPQMLGNEVAARVCASRPELPVLYMSGYAQPILDDQGGLDPHVDLLEKPFTAATLLTRVRQAIDSRGEPGAGEDSPDLICRT
jgi:PAS domain S-box-containing protein